MLKWPIGAVIAQACHASLAAIVSHSEEVSVKTYIHKDNVESMHKVVVEVPNESDLHALSERLSSSDVAHHLWIEQPENTPTCLATVPNDKSTVQKHFKHLKLFK